VVKSGRTALCLSGGGIRSATFSLGVIQWLGQHGLLKQFDFLSTVSAAATFGSWLSAWIHRHPRASSA
jgi:predicted acylesterase/phospholipase RssA